MSQVETAARRRQQVLDFLLLNPGAKMGVIGAALFGEAPSRSRHHNTLKNMVEWNEVRFIGTPRSRQYWANVSITRPALEVQQARETGIRRKNSDRAAVIATRTARNVLGIYVHKPSEKPIPNQGGQGCIRRTVYVNCQQFY